MTRPEFRNMTLTTVGIVKAPCDDAAAADADDGLFTFTAMEYWNQWTYHHLVPQQDDEETKKKSMDGPQVKPCGFSFDGAAYQGLDVSTLDPSALQYLQEHLRIIDPLYGWLRPMDGILPYRLEMATRNVFQPSPNNNNNNNNKERTIKSMTLAEFWRPVVHRHIMDQTPPSQAHFLLNLASEEYSVVVDPPSSVKVNKPSSSAAPAAAVSHGALTIPTVVKVIFRNSGRVIAIHAKRARGLMARYMAQHQITTLDGIKGFQEEGYTFQITESNGTTLVFDRPKQWNRATSDTTEKDNKTKTSSSVSSLTTTHHQKKRPRRSKP